jgi:hypothetical protein
MVTLAAGTGYTTMGSSWSATVTIKDDESADVEVRASAMAGSPTICMKNTGKGTKSVTFRPNLAQAGDV